MRASLFITPGYRITFSTPQGPYVVRTDQRGRNIRIPQAEPGFQPPVAAPGPSAPLATTLPGENLPPAVVGGRAALVDQLGLSIEQVQIKSFDAVELRDSCLGAAKPGEMCLQLITPGYRIVFSTPKGDYEVHTNRTGAAARVVPVAG